MKILVTKMLLAQAEAYFNAGLFTEGHSLMMQRNMLLTNGYQPPIPRKFLNQRQRRKRARQNQH